MNRRITKTMAENAANVMKEKVYGPKIETVETRVDKEVENLVRKYIPSPVIACTNEYPKYFRSVNGATITTYIDDNGYLHAASYIKGKLTFKIPDCSNYIVVTEIEYKELRRLDDVRKRLVNEREDLGKRIFDALVALRTENAVKKELPEALKYLVFPEVKAVPMETYNYLRFIMGSIKEK